MGRNFYFYISQQDIYNNPDNKIHICKTSSGLKTMFDTNDGKYYKPSKFSLNCLLSTKGSCIVDEYNNAYTLSEFWDYVYNHDLNNKDCLKPSNNRLPYDYYEKVGVTQLAYHVNVEPNCLDFLSDGLRWSLYSNFT